MTGIRTYRFEHTAKRAAKHWAEKLGRRTSYGLRGFGWCVYVWVEKREDWFPLGK